VINISADMGEGSPNEDAIWPLITSANVACGGHTGDVSTMTRAAQRAAECGVRVGAHPSYPDRENFGRVTMEIEPADLRDSLTRQIESLRAIAPVEFVKAHGALYNDAHRDGSLAALLVDVIARIDSSLSIVCAASSQMAAAAREVGIRVVREAFADRRYEPDGSLTPRKIAGSLLSVEEAAKQAALLAAEGMVIARDGSPVSITIDTLSIHADMDRALERLRAVRRAVLPL
jgi:UPF0271 protein